MLSLTDSKQKTSRKQQSYGSTQNYTSNFVLNYYKLPKFESWRPIESQEDVFLQNATRNTTENAVKTIKS